MKYLFYILFFLTLTVKSQIADLPNVRLCGDVVRDTLTVSHLEFGNCGQLLMQPNSVLIVDTNLYGEGRIVCSETATIIYNSCIEANNIAIPNNITQVLPNGCETLSIGDVDFNDYIGEFECVAYNNLGQKVSKGKFKDFKPTVAGVYNIRFEFGSLRALYDNNGNRL